VLPTWTRALASHPRGHGRVPAGEVSADHQPWRPARQTSRVPVRALSKMVRGRFCAMGHQERPDLTLPESVWTTDGVVSGQPTVQGTEQVLDYWGRYVHRLALTNSRMRSSDHGQICCRSADSRTHRWHTMTLPAQACIRRCLPHVWPLGCHTVRSSGLWSPTHRSLRHRRQRCLAGHAPSAPRASPDQARRPPAREYAPPQAGQHGRPCGQGVRVVIRLRPRHQTGPPCAPDPPCGRPMPAASRPPVPGPVAPSHPCARLPDTRAESPRPPRPAALGSHLASGSSPLGPPRWITGTPPLIARMCFPTGSGCLKMPYEREPRFRSTTFLWRLRATKTLRLVCS
jgi:hypothetical protein